MIRRHPLTAATGRLLAWALILALCAPGLAAQSSAGGGGTGGGGSGGTTVIFPDVPGGGGGGGGGGGNNHGDLPDDLVSGGGGGGGGSVPPTGLPPGPGGSGGGGGGGGVNTPTIWNPGGGGGTTTPPSDVDPDDNDGGGNGSATAWTPARDLVVRVLDATGRPVSGVVLDVRAVDGSLLGTSRTDRRGLAVVAYEGGSLPALHATELGIGPVPFRPDGTALIVVPATEVPTARR